MLRREKCDCEGNGCEECTCSYCGEFTTTLEEYQCCDSCLDNQL